MALPLILGGAAAIAIAVAASKRKAQNRQSRLGRSSNHDLQSAWAPPGVPQEVEDYARTQSQSRSQSSGRDHPTSSLGQRLTKAGWVLYTVDGCSFCVKQKEELKRLGITNSVTVRACSGSEPECEKMEGFPAWKNSKTGKIEYGLLLESDLKALVE